MPLKIEEKMYLEWKIRYKAVEDLPYFDFPLIQKYYKPLPRYQGFFRKWFNVEIYVCYLLSTKKEKKMWYEEFKYLSIVNMYLWNKLGCVILMDRVHFTIIASFIYAILSFVTVFSII